MSGESKKRLLRRTSGVVEESIAKDRRIVELERQLAAAKGQVMKLEALGRADGEP